MKHDKKHDFDKPPRFSEYVWRGRTPVRWLLSLSIFIVFSLLLPVFLTWYLHGWSAEIVLRLDFLLVIVTAIAVFEFFLFMRFQASKNIENKPESGIMHGESFILTGIVGGIAAFILLMFFDLI